MAEYSLNSVEEMFKWKLKKKELDKEKQLVSPRSVEDANLELTKGKTSLNWEITDVLYSFTLIYYLLKLRT